MATRKRKVGRPSKEETRKRRNEEAGAEPEEKERKESEPQILVVANRTENHPQWFLVPRKVTSAADLNALRIFTEKGTTDSLGEQNLWCENLLYWRLFPTSTISPPSDSAYLLQGYKHAHGYDYTGGDDKWTQYRISPGYVIPRGSPHTEIYSLFFTL